MSRKSSCLIVATVLLVGFITNVSEAKSLSAFSSGVKGKKAAKMAHGMHIYKCETCGKTVELHPGSEGQLMCCGHAMQVAPEKTSGAGSEKHLPVLEKTANGVQVTVGKVSHPMLEAHYIEWIEVITKNKAYRQYLEPGQPPEAIFIIVPTEVIAARAYCNLHGLWKSEFSTN